MPYNVFERWLGPSLTKEIANARFEESDDPLILYRFRKSVMVVNPLQDMSKKEEVLKRYLLFFEELIDKMQMDAVSLIPGILIEDDMTAKMLSPLQLYLEKVITGHELYLPHLESKPRPKGEEITKGVDVVVALLITKPTLMVRLDVPIEKMNLTKATHMLEWVVATEAWVKDPEQPGILGRLCTIEQFGLD